MPQPTTLPREPQSCPYTVLKKKCTELRGPIFWVVMPCSTPQAHRRFVGSKSRPKTGGGLLMVSCLDYSLTLKLDAIRSPEMLVDLYRSTRRYDSEDSALHRHRHEFISRVYWIIFKIRFSFYSAKSLSNQFSVLLIYVRNFVLSTIISCDDGLFRSSFIQFILYYILQLALQMSRLWQNNN
jgi:hypothetical protein